MLDAALLFLHVLLVLVLSYYLMSALQWYSYRLKRVLFHFNKPLWHLFFLVIPIFAYYFMGLYFWGYFFIAYLPSLYMWYKKLDKPLVFTKRVKRFFVFLLLAVVFQDILCLALQRCELFGVFMPLAFSLLVSFLFEKILFSSFYKEAKKKIFNQEDLKIITITASFGKTSIKNFLYEILKSEFACYKTPRSVNTLAGLVQDINTSLPKQTQVYITEAGAREKGDIAEIAEFLEPHIAIVGEIGAQHIEYFKILENVRNTKMELIKSKRLEVGFVHKSANINPNKKINLYGDGILQVKADLEGTSFELEIDSKIETFRTPLLGAFNATNLAVCIYVARYLGISLEKIKKSVASLKSVEHRLQRIDAGGKIILDDSFNGNFEGMSASYELVSIYEGRKVLITPGIIESTKEENKKLGLIMNDIFDVVILTGSLNTSILASVLKKPEVIFLKDKTQMEQILGEHTQAGDIILFSNDAPGFI